MGVHSETPSEAERAVSRVGLEPTTYGLKGRDRAFISSHMRSFSGVLAHWR